MELIKKLEESTNYDGNPRHFGLEIEYAGLPLVESAKIISDILGTDIVIDHTTHYKFPHPDLGDFILELDVELAQKISERAKKSKGQGDELAAFHGLTDSVVSEVLGTVAPSELVTPPLLAQDLPCVSNVVKALRKAGAKGTSGSILFAFGYHVNPEARSLDAESILKILQSYSLLHEALVQILDMDITRRLSGYAAAYNPKYIELIFKDGYAPNITELMTDYMTYNPSRNYALDLLPLFSFIDESLVNKTCPNSLIKTRPTYHFRLPNSRITQSNWNIYDGIHAWVLVEDLADKPELMNELSTLYFKTHNKHKPSAGEWFEKAA